MFTDYIHKHVAQCLSGIMLRLSAYTPYILAILEYRKSKTESQQEMAMLPQTKAFFEARKREAEELKQRVQQLAAEHHSERQSKEREVTSYRLDGFTARVLSSQEGRVDAVCVLIEANASVNQQTKVMEPLHVESSYSGSVLPFLPLFLPLFHLLPTSVPPFLPPFPPSVPEG